MVSSLGEGGEGGGGTFVGGPLGGSMRRHQYLPPCPNPMSNPCPHLLSSSTEFSDSIHSGSTSPSQMIHERCSRGSLTTLRAAAVSTPSDLKAGGRRGQDGGEVFEICVWPRRLQCQ